MRVLYLTYACPMPPVDGGRRRQSVFVSALAREHEVDLLSFIDEAVPPDRDALSDCRSLRLIERDSWGASQSALARPLRALKRRITRVPTLSGTHSRPMSEAVESALRAGSYDLAVADSLYMGHYVLTADSRKMLDLSDLLSSAVGLEIQTSRSSVRRALLRAHRRNLEAVEARLGAAYDAVVLPTEREAQDLERRLRRSNVHVVPNAFDCSPYPDVPAPPEEPSRILFCGSMDYFPNADAALWFAREIFPEVARDVPGATLTVIGKNPSREVEAMRSEAVEVTGFVSDTSPYYRRAAVAVAPLRYGGGARVKILEAMASGRPVVATSFGAAGLGVEDGVDIKLADDPADFARAVSELLRDRQLASRIARAARALVLDRYDAAGVGTRFVELCESLTDGS